MSEPIPEAVPTSQDPRSKRPVKRRALTPLSEQATEIDRLFKDPSKEVRLPNPSKTRTASSLAPPPEIVANVQGSSAGAGSGEFHVYKASRRREYERVRLMDEELSKEKAKEEFERKREELKRKDEEKTEKNRRKREKRKAGKGKKGPGPAKPGPASSTDMDTEKNGADTDVVDQNGEEKGPENDEDGSGSKDYAEPLGVIIHEDD